MEPQSAYGILKNKLGLRGERTTEVVLVHSFMNAVFNIEKHYGSEDFFYICKDKKYYRHHLTNADLQLAVILQKICTVDGFIRNIKVSDIYRMVERYFEKPVTYTQVLVSLTKFILNGIIDQKPSKYIDASDYKLNNYWNEEQGNVGFFLQASNFIFTDEFDCLSLATKKLYFTSIFRRKRDLQRFYLHERNTEDVQYNHLLKFLHLSDTSQLKRILATEIKGVPLFSKRELYKVDGKYQTAEIEINPSFKIEQTSIGTQTKWHDAPQPLQKYERVEANLIEAANEAGVGEITTVSSFSILLRQLRKQRKSVIRFIMSKIKEHVQAFGAFPSYIPSFVKELLAKHRSTKILSAIQKAGLQFFVRPPHLSLEEQNQAEQTFLGSISHILLKDFKALLQVVKQEVVTSYIKPELNTVTFDKYKAAHIVGEYAPGYVVQAFAFNMRKSPLAFKALLHEFVENIHQQSSELFASSSEKRIAWLMDRVEELPTIEELPSAIQDKPLYTIFQNVAAQYSLQLS